MGSLREKDIEREFVRAVRLRGGICPKLTCPGFDGMPDRLVLLPGGKMGFTEVKTPGKKPRPLQEARLRLLKTLGFPVFVLDRPEKIGGILDAIQAP